MGLKIREFPEFRTKSGRNNNYYDRDKIFENLLAQIKFNDNNMSNIYTDYIFKNDLKESLRFLDLIGFWENKLRKTYSVVSSLDPENINLSKIKNEFYPEDPSNEVRKRRPILKDILLKVRDLLLNCEVNKSNLNLNLTNEIEEKIDYLYKELINILQTLEKVKSKNVQNHLQGWLTKLNQYKNFELSQKIDGLKWIYNELSDKEVLNQWFLRICEKMRHWYLSEFSKEVYKTLVSRYDLKQTERRLFIVMNIGLKELDYRLPVLEPILMKYFRMEKDEFQNFLNFEIYRPEKETQINEMFLKARREKRNKYRTRIKKYLLFYPIFCSILSDKEEDDKYYNKNYSGEDKEDIINNIESENIVNPEKIPKLFLEVMGNDSSEFTEELKKVCTQRELNYIYYFFWEGRNQEEIAKIFNVTQANVSKTIKKAINKLKESKIIKELISK